jgi:hypothetical protein
MTFTPTDRGTKAIFGLGRVKGCGWSADYDYNAKRPLLDFYWRLRKALLL